jgi:hypothetical protein
VAFLDDATGRHFGGETQARNDVSPPDQRIRRGDGLPGTPVTRRTEQSQEQYGTIAEHILATHAKQSVESYALKQFMG